MREQLHRFALFASQLLPHETRYLLSVQQFQDVERLGILQLVDENCHLLSQFAPYDTKIDKRKYNHLQNWIGHTLQTIDVDHDFEWIIRMEQKIMTDSIGVDDERELIRKIQKYQHPSFYFNKFYELVEYYREFVLIRIRYAEYDITEEFLSRYRVSYEQSKKVSARLHDATEDIVGQYSGAIPESIQWEKWLVEVFYDENCDGHNRYLALVRLIFISFNYGKYEMLQDKFDYLDIQFAKGRYYSKRLLLNYYSNRLLFHSHYREYEKAVYYGYLSIRSKNHDYIHYVNNLCAVLLRLERYEEALSLMKGAAPDLKRTGNMHSRVGFASFYLQAMNKNKLYKNAEHYGDTFLQAFSREVLEYRWHLFFSVYFEALLHRQAFRKILELALRYKLNERDRKYQRRPSYLPTIPIYIEMASYKEGDIDRKTVLKRINTLSEKYLKEASTAGSLRDFLQLLQPVMPEVINYVY